MGIATWCLEGMARISKNLGNSAEALTYYTSALTKCEMITDDDRSALTPMIAVTLNKVGVLLSNQGQGEQALEFHIRALATKLSRPNR